MIKNLIFIFAFLAPMAPAAVALAQSVENDPSGLDLVSVESEIQNKPPKKVSKFIEKTSSTMDKVVEAAKSNKVSGTLKQDIDLGNDGKISIRNKIEIEPAYIGGYYLRKDSYEAPITFKAGEWALDDNTVLNIPIHAGANFSLYRYFDEYSEALSPRKKLPFVDYVLNYLPITANRILENMRPGDMIKMQMPLVVRIGVAYTQELTPLLSAKVGAYKVLSGVFNVYVFRAENNKIRLRIVGLNGDQKELRGQIGIMRNQLATGLRLLIRAGGGFQILDYKSLSGESNIYLSDYTLDFNHQKVRDAYDDLFGRAMAFKDSNISTMLVKMINPWASHEELRDVLVTNLTGLEDIYKEDLNISNPSERRIHRNFVGANQADAKKGRRYNINVPLVFKANWTSNLNESRLTRRQTTLEDGEIEEIRENFIFPSWTFLKKKSSPLASYREELLRSSNVIFRADDDFNPNKFLSIGFYYDSKDSRYRPREHKSLIQHFQGILPKNIFQDVLAEMEQKGIRTLDSAIRNIKVSSRYFINDKGLEAAEERFANKSREATQNEILKLAIEHVRNSGLTHNGQQQKTLPRACRENGVSLNTRDIAARYCRQLIIISKELSVVVSRSEFPQNRKSAMENLVKVPLFREIGPGFLFSLLPEVNFNETVRFELRFFLPQQIEPITILRGEPMDRDLYEQLLDQQNQLIDQEPDLRLDGTKDTLTERNTAQQ